MDKIQGLAETLRTLTYSEMRQLARELSDTAKDTLRAKYNFIELSETLNAWSENRTRPLAVEPVSEKPVKVEIDATQNAAKPVVVRAADPMNNSVGGTASPAPPVAAPGASGP